MRAMLLIVASVSLLGGCFLSPDENRIDLYGTDTGCDPGGDIVEGMEDACQDDGDCSEGAPDCFKNPLDPSQSGCTIMNCSAEDCPACFKCCDCSSLDPTMILCLPEVELGGLPTSCTCS